MKLFDQVSNAIAIQAATLQAAFMQAFKDLPTQINAISESTDSALKSATSTFISASIANGQPLSVEAAFAAGVNFGVGQVLQAVSDAVHSSTDSPSTGGTDPSTSTGQAAFTPPPPPPVIDSTTVTASVDQPSTDSPSTAPLADALKETAQSPNQSAAG